MLSIDNLVLDSNILILVTASAARDVRVRDTTPPRMMQKAMRIIGFTCFGGIFATIRFSLTVE